MRTLTTRLLIACPLLCAGQALAQPLEPVVAVRGAARVAASWICQEPQPRPAGEAPESLRPLASTERDARLWLKRLDQRFELWPRAESKLLEIIDELEAQLAADTELLPAIVETLLNLASYRMTRVPQPADFLGGSAKALAREHGQRSILKILSGNLREPLLDHLYHEVMLQAQERPLCERYYTLGLLDSRRLPQSKLVFLSLVRNEADPLRGALLEILPSWPDDAVDGFLVDNLGKPYDRYNEPHPFNLMLERVRSNKRPLGQGASQAIRRRLAMMLLSTDWRDASRAIELTPGLQAEDGVPMMIEALSIWQRRAERGMGSKRIAHDIVRCLRDISGRSLGTNPHNWRTWWTAVRQGRIALHSGDTPGATKARQSFFGLRPVSDRVTFIIDKSGSMDTKWGTQQHNRYEEAIEQLMLFLQAAGQETRYNIILFSSAPISSSGHLVKATTEYMERTRSSLLARKPKGGTNLRSAVEMALKLDSRGYPDLDRLEADTIVILCDGETAQGPGWVAPLIQRVGVETRVVFHCAQIDSAGDGTLEQLARLTGGDFIRVGR